MGTYNEFVAEGRRAAILQMLAKADGTASEDIIHTTLRVTQFPRLTRDQLLADLDWLRDKGCVRHEWLHDEVLIATLTARGQNAARGDITIQGVSRPERIR